MGEEIPGDHGVAGGGDLTGLKAAAFVGSKKKAEAALASGATMRAQTITRNRRSPA